MQISNLINRLDLTSLEKIVSTSVLKTIQSSEELPPGKIKEILCHSSSIQYIIESKEKTLILLSFLKPDEAAEFAGFLSVEASILKNTVSLLYDKGNLELIYNFFGLPYTSVAVEALPNIENVTPARGLRDYQSALIEEFKQSYSKNNNSKVLLHLPTGAGKTRIAIRFLSEQMATNNNNFLWIANDHRLLRQAEDEFKITWSHVGDVSARIFRLNRHVDRSELGKNIKTGFFITVQSYYELFRSNDIFFKEIARCAKIIVFDEAHQIIAETYRTAVETIRYYSQNAYLIGLSATPGRSTLEIDEDIKLKEFFGGNKIKLKTDKFGCSNPFKYLIDQKYLAKPNFIRLEYDLKEVSKLNFLYNKIIELTDRYKKILIFCDSIEEINILSDSLRFKFENTFGVHSKNTDYLNNKAIETLRNKEIKEPVIVLNYEMLMTGFDAPGIDCLIIAKNSNSVIDFSQMVGRGLRGPNSGGSEEVMIYHIQNQEHSFYVDLDTMFNFWEGVWNEQ